MNKIIEHYKKELDTILRFHKTKDFYDISNVLDRTQAMAYTEFIEKLSEPQKEQDTTEENLNISGVMLRFSDDEKKLNIDGLESAIAICDWDNYNKEDYENPKAQISWYYHLIAKLNEA